MVLYSDAANKSFFILPFRDEFKELKTLERRMLFTFIGFRIYSGERGDFDESYFASSCKGSFFFFRLVDESYSA